MRRKEKFGWPSIYRQSPIDITWTHHSIIAFTVYKLTFTKFDLNSETIAIHYSYGPMKNAVQIVCISFALFRNDQLRIVSGIYSIDIATSLVRQVNLWRIFVYSPENSLVWGIFCGKFFLEIQFFPPHTHKWICCAWVQKWTEPIIDHIDWIVVIKSNHGNAM